LPAVPSQVAEFESAAQTLVAATDELAGNADELRCEAAAERGAPVESGVIVDDDEGVCGQHQPQLIGRVGQPPPV
jgi:hypothetical protein